MKRLNAQARAHLIAAVSPEQGVFSPCRIASRLIVWRGRLVRDHYVVVARWRRGIGGRR